MFACPDLGVCVTVWVTFPALTSCACWPTGLNRSFQISSSEERNSGRKCSSFQALRLPLSCFCGQAKICGSRKSLRYCYGCGTLIPFFIFYVCPDDEDWTEDFAILMRFGFLRSDWWERWCNYVYGCKVLNQWNIDWKLVPGIPRNIERVNCW